MKELNDLGLSPSFPDIKKGRELTNMLFQIGVYKQGFSGIVPVDWVDIKAWSDLTGVVLTGEEARILRKLSEDYCQQFSTSKHITTKSPFFDEQERANGIDALFGAL
jgi:hypothetical protein